jgi:hypothetical protein
VIANHTHAEREKMNSYSEEKAKTLWCPMARETGYVEFRDGEVAPSVNRQPKGDAHAACLCIASACMMWQWGSPEGTGYCGLARH